MINLYITEYPGIRIVQKENQVEIRQLIHNTVYSISFFSYASKREARKKYLEERKRYNSIFDRRNNKYNRHKEL